MPRTDQTHSEQLATICYHAQADQLFLVPSVLHIRWRKMKWNGFQEGVYLISESDSSGDGLTGAVAGDSSRDG